MVNQRKDFIINFMYFTIIAVLMFLGFKYLLPILIPFIIAFSIVYLLQKPVSLICGKLKTKHRKTVSILILILFYGIIGIILGVAGIGVYSVVLGVAERVPEVYSGEIEPFLNTIYTEMIKINNDLTPEVRQTIIEILQNMFVWLKDALVSLSNMLVNGMTNMVTVIPGFFVSFIISIISSFFFAADYEKITHAISSLVSHKYKIFLNEVKWFLRNKLWVIIKSYFKIMCLTFTELAIAFTICNIDNALLLALCIAIFDILPIFGTGGVMIPWAVIALISGHYVLALKLIIIYLIITIIRNIAEPKLVGAELGLHPILTLILMVVGVNLFGVIGLFGFPIIASFYVYWCDKYNCKIE